jgi:hypothetical protein
MLDDKAVPISSCLRGIRYIQDLYGIVCVVRPNHLRLFIAKGFLSSGAHNLTALSKSRLFRIYFIKNRPCVGFFMPDDKAALTSFRLRGSAMHGFLRVA